MKTVCENVTGNTILNYEDVEPGLIQKVWNVVNVCPTFMPIDNRKTLSEVPRQTVDHPLMLNEFFSG